MKDVYIYVERKKDTQSEIKKNRLKKNENIQKERKIEKEIKKDRLKSRNRDNQIGKE